MNFNSRPKKYVKNVPRGSEITLVAKIHVAAMFDIHVQKSDDGWIDVSVEVSPGVHFTVATELPAPTAPRGNDLQECQIPMKVIKVSSSGVKCIVYYHCDEDTL